MKRKSRAMVVILFGPPGSGKSTQASLLSRRFGLVRIAPGDILRAHMAAGDALGREVASVVRAGGLVPDDVINRLITDRIAGPDCGGGFILDGYPRTRSQAGALIGVLRRLNCDPAVIQLTLDLDVAVARLSGRQECPTCGALYHVVSRPPKSRGVCDADGTKLIVRSDDSAAAIQARLSVYQVQTEPVLKLLSDAGYVCKPVAANSPSPETAAEQIADWLYSARNAERTSAAPAIPQRRRQSPRVNIGFDPLS